MTDCARTDPHDHADPRLPDWFHAWLRGERRRAPALASWKAQRPIGVPFGTVSGREWTDSQRAAHGYWPTGPRLPGTR